MYQRDGNWMVKITRPNEKTLYFNLGKIKKSEARKLEIKLKQENRPGGLLFDNKISDECLTVSGLFELFIENSYAKAAKGKKRVKTVDNEKEQTTRLVAELGDLLLPDVTPAVLEAYMAKRLEVRSPVTVHHEMSLLRRAFKCAREILEITNLNPFRNVELPSGDNPRDCFLFEPQVKALLSAYKKSAWPWLHDMAVVALETGFRRSTLCNLKLHQLDFKDRAIYIRAGEMKNKRPIHKPMSDNVYRILKARMSRKVVGIGFVFTLNGEPIDPSHITHCHLKVRMALADRVERWREPYERFVWHGWRHQHSSKLAISGADINDIAEANGQRDLSTAKGYTHLQSGRKRSVIEQAFPQIGYGLATGVKNK